MKNVNNSSPTLSAVKPISNENIIDHRLDALLPIFKIKASLQHLRFIDYTWQNPFEPYIIGKHTRIVCRAIDSAIERFSQGESVFLLISLPFRHGKSEIVSRKLPAHFLGLFPDCKVILSGHNHSLTEGYSRDSRDLILTQQFQELFPGVSIDRTLAQASRWKIAGHNGECYAAGLMGGLTGQGGHLLILDDYCAGREDAESQTMRDKSWEVFSNNFMTRRAPHSIVIVLATRWHVDDIIGRIKQSMLDDPAYPRFEEINLPAFSDEYPSGVLFPERFPVSWYEEQRAVLGAYGSAALLQGNPIARGGNLLNVDRVVRHVSLEDFPKIAYYRVWDLAHTSAERMKSNPDYTSGTLLGFSMEEGVPHLWVKDVSRFRLSGPERDARIMATAQADGAFVKIAIENTLDAKDAVSVMTRILSGIREVIPIRVSKDKVIRAYPLETIFNAGNVHVPSDALWLDNWIEEIAAFPNCAHDDQVDNLSSGYELCMKSANSAIPEEYRKWFFPK